MLGFNKATKANGKAPAKKEPVIQSGSSQAPARSGMPMFFRNPRPLDAARHVTASISPTSDYSFARDTNSIVLNAIEFIEAAKSYPIVFTSDEAPLPAAIMGMEKGNYFVGADNGWKAEYYVPAYVRQYPFLFLERAEEQKFYLCIDEGAANYSTTSKSDRDLPLYKDGKASPVTDNALQFCTAFYNHFSITKNFCADLKKHGLLTPYHSEATLKSGRKVSLSGFQMIDEKALAKLPDETFLEFRTKGWLPFIYLSLASASNWKRLADMAETRRAKPLN